MAKIDLNQNQADCIHSASNWTHSTYYNICTNTQMDVPLGAWDYIGITIFCFIGLAFVGMLFGFMFHVWRELDW